MADNMEVFFNNHEPGRHLLKFNRLGFIYLTVNVFEINNIGIVSKNEKIIEDFGNISLSTT